MAEVYKTFAGIKDSIFLMPLRAIMFYTQNEAAEELKWTHIFYPESESNWQVKPITRAHGKGGKITLGYRLTARIYVSHNNYADSDLLPLLDEYAARRDYPETGNANELTVRPQIVLYIGNYPPPHCPAPVPKVINSTNGMWLELGHSATLSYEIESVELRPRLILDIEGVYKTLRTSSDGKMFN